MQESRHHTTVLLREAVDALLQDAGRPYPGAQNGTYIDATFGRGGHTRRLLSELSEQGRVIGFDRDAEAVASAANIVDSRFVIRHAAFSQVADLAEGSVDGILMDLGVSSPQIDSPERGFSFRFDGPLDMRMDTSRGQSVAQWLLGAQVNEIAEVIREYGEERFAGSIAKAIVARREAGRAVSSTAELAQLVADTVKTREAGQNPATRTFQAFRIFINSELEELRQALNACLRILQAGGRLVVISFHSLEDRIVKQFIAEHSREVFDRRTPFAPPKAMQLRAVARIKPTIEEVATNPRARSAIMRIAQRMPT